MFDLAWSELLVVGLVAVLVLGPKELPQAMRTLAKAIRKVRSLGAEFQGHFNEMLREAELDEVRKQVQKFSKTSLTEHVTKMVDPDGEVKRELDSAFKDPDAKTPDAAAGETTPAVEDQSSSAASETAAPAPSENVTAPEAPPEEAPAKTSGAS